MLKLVLQKESIRKKAKPTPKSPTPPKIMIKYDWNGNFVGEEIQGNHCSFLYRLSVQGKFFYRDKEILEKEYGTIPKTINVDRIKPFLSNRKRIFIGTKDSGEQIICYQLKDLPCTKSQFYFAFNHDIPDEWGYKWKIKIRHYRLPKR